LVSPNPIPDLKTVGINHITLCTIKSLGVVAGPWEGHSPLATRVQIEGLLTWTRRCITFFFALQRASSDVGGKLRVLKNPPI